MVRIHEIMHMLPYSRLFCTKSYHYGAIFCEALLIFFMSKRFSRHVIKILDDVLSTCLLAGHDGIFFQCQANIPNILPTWRHVSGRHVIWGVLASDMTPTFPTKRRAKQAIWHHLWELAWIIQQELRLQKANQRTAYAKFLNAKRPNEWC